MTLQLQRVTYISFCKTSWIRMIEVQVNLDQVRYSRKFCRESFCRYVLLSHGENPDLVSIFTFIALRNTRLFQCYNC